LSVRGEEDKFKTKLAALLAAVNFWLKHEGKVEPTLKVKVEDEEFSATITQLGEREFEIEVDREKFKVKHTPDLIAITQAIVPKERKIALPKAVKPKLTLEEGEVLVKAQTAGKIIEILVKSGDEVKENSPLIIIEAMKMELEVTAPHPGRVRKILVKVGDEVKIGDPLIILKKSK